MARITQDREDLLLEATALVPRVMLKTQIKGKPSNVFAGFRGESLSVYFDASPVYHFNRSGELRRAFIGECLFKAANGQLVRTVRERSATQVVLASTAVTVEQAKQLAVDLTARLQELQGNLGRGDCELVGQVPPDGNGLSRLETWLAEWSGFKIARVANVD